MYDFDFPYYHILPAMLYATNYTIKLSFKFRARLLALRQSVFLPNLDIYNLVDFGGLTSERTSSEMFLLKCLTNKTDFSQIHVSDGDCF